MTLHQHNGRVKVHVGVGGFSGLGGGGGRGGGLGRSDDGQWIRNGWW